MHNPPFVSVVVPVRNDPAGIARTLASLFAQDWPGDRHEIIVVDNHSSDDTLAVIRETARDYTGKLRIEQERRRGSYAARNRGIRVARGEIIAFIDADMTVPPDWLGKGVRCMVDGRHDYVGCRIELYSESASPSLGEKYNLAAGFPVRRYLEVGGFAPTACLFVARRVFDAIGLFDERLESGGDVEFGNRARDHGYRLHFAADNPMFHPARSSLSALLRKQARVVLGQIELRRLYPERYSRNRPADVLLWACRLLPVVDTYSLKALYRKPWSEFMAMLGMLYLLRLYACWIKLRSGSLF